MLPLDYLKLIILTFLLIATRGVQAHQASATYIANEAVLISNGESKVLFDPFFHNAFGTYQLVPEETKQAIFNAKPPFDNITAIIISHAHGDHFAADEVLRYLKTYSATQLIAPQQAIDELMSLPDAKGLKAQVTAVQLAFNDPPQRVDVSGLVVEAVRIPHAGWPGRAEVENIVFRVTLEDSQNNPLTVMHMGDADANDDHYLPYKSHWQSRESEIAFPPYWFYFSAEGNDILNEIINAKQHVGVHVPVKVPKQLKESDKDYFSKPGEKRVLQKGHQH